MQRITAMSQHIALSKQHIKLDIHQLYFTKMVAAEQSEKNEREQTEISNQHTN